MEASKNLAKNIIRYQKEHHLTNAALAKSFGVSTSTLYKLKKGVGDFRSDTLYNIARVMGRSPASLLTDPDEEQHTAELAHIAKLFAGLSPKACDKVMYHLRQTIVVTREDEQKRQANNP